MTTTDTEFLAIFADEANDRLDAIVEALLTLEGGRGNAETIDALMRDAHTIKGGAGMLGLGDVRALAHAMEDVLEEARGTGTLPAEFVDPLLRAADALRHQVAGTGEAAPELIAELTAVHAGLHETRNGAEPAATAASRPTSERRSLRIPAEKLDQLLDLVGESVLHRRRLEHVLEASGAAHEVEAVADELSLGERLFDELQDAAVGMRTRPLASIVGSLPRALRDIASAEGKHVELVVSGAETELDRVILEGLSEPIVHVLRNAVAHGIELPGDRTRAGKPSLATIELRAEQRGRIVALTISDDGRGVPAEALARVRSGVPLADVLAQAGFSTASEVTDLAGRGVGLDAVKTYAESVGGSLDVESEPGRGTTITLLLPLTLALLRVLLVERGGHVFGLPLASVSEAIQVREQLVLGGRPALDLRGETVPLADLAAQLDGAASAVQDGAPAIVVSAAGRRVAVVCDALLGEEEVVVKTLGPLLAGVRGYLGAAILGDGRIALLLDPSTLVRSPRRVSRRPEAAEPAVAGAASKVLVVDDAFTVRELQRSILEASGYDVETARDGKDAFDLLLRDEGIALVVSDIEMPEMTGLELTQAIRADARLASLPVVLVTSLGDEAARKRGVDAGADAYMVKSDFDQQTLLETVGRLIGR